MFPKSWELTDEFESIEDIWKLRQNYGPTNYNPTNYNPNLKHGAIGFAVG